MEQIPLVLKEANRLFRNSDHLTYMTYPLVQDKRLLLRILENLNTSLSKFMEVLLYYDFVYEHGEKYPESFGARFDFFRRNCAKKYGVGETQMNMIREIHDIAEERSKSTMEFIRGGDYIIATKDFKLRRVGIEQIKKWINESRSFVMKVNSVAGK